MKAMRPDTRVLAMAVLLAASRAWAAAAAAEVRKALGKPE